MVCPAFRVYKLSERPWTILTYMFSDTGSALMRLLSNMLWLWAFGYILQELSVTTRSSPFTFMAGSPAGYSLSCRTTLCRPARPGRLPVALRRQCRHHGSSNGHHNPCAQLPILYTDPWRIPIWVVDAGIPADRFCRRIRHERGLQPFPYRRRTGRIPLRTVPPPWNRRQFVDEPVLPLADQPVHPAQGPSREELRDKIFYQTGSRNPSRNPRSSHSNG